MTTNTKWTDLKQEVDPNRPTYSFTAERDGDWWFVKADDLERVFTQVRRLDQAEEMARDVTALMLDVEPDSFNVRIDPILDSSVRTLVDRARTKREALDALQGQASAVNAAAAQKLVDKGYSLRDIGVLLGVSFQRAGQLSKASIPFHDLDEDEAALFRAPVLSVDETIFGAGTRSATPWADRRAAAHVVEHDRHGRTVRDGIRNENVNRIAAKSSKRTTHKR